MDQPNPDLGRYAIIKDPNDWGAFKTPGLRNVAKTYPYLHNGSEATLLDVVKFYNRGGIPNKNLDPLMMPLNLTGQEERDLVSFLESLTGPYPIESAPPLPAGPEPIPGVVFQGGAR
jgi:cytochrome c peroxidase